MKLRGPLGTLALVAAVSIWTVDANAQFQDLSEITASSQRPTPQGGVQGSTVNTGGAAAAESDQGAGEAARPNDSSASYHVNIHGAAPKQRSGQNLAQVVAMDPMELYRGIIPGQRDLLPHLEQAQNQGQVESRPNQLTWIGFLPEERRTRVFFQGARAPQYEMQRSSDGKSLTITFRNARLPKKNFSRFIDTSFFERTVTRIETKAQRGDVIVTVSLRDGAQPTVNREGAYIFFDFSHTPAAPAGEVARTND
ncbi:MAG: AMIN domain-containing protein [Bradymonadaceae bacterium]